LPVGILSAFIVMHWQGINANIMSLGGIAIAIGAMVDGAIVMIENVHKHIERTPLTDKNRWQVIGKAAEEVGAPLFFSLLIITLSFVPVFALEGQEGKMFLSTTTEFKPEIPEIDDCTGVGTDGLGLLSNQ